MGKRLSPERRMYRRNRVALKRALWAEAAGPPDPDGWWRGTVGCHWCGRPLTYPASVVDHEPPLSRGGRWFLAVLACGPCDQRRAAENRRPG